MSPQANIRNFCIIAHIDHGKSTLADRLLEATGTVAKTKLKAQMLDTMDLERERGITIKLQPVRMTYRLPQNGTRSTESAKSEIRSSNYELNLIDTPGHVDFTYEVSRSLAACEGALLIVDGSQGIQAQTLANIYMAIDGGLTIIPVINKIDLPAADPAKTATEITQILGCQPNDIYQVSAKTGQGVDELLEAIVTKIPAPKGAPDGSLRALVFDSIYDEYRGVILYVRVVDGKLTNGDQIRLMASNTASQALEVGHFNPALSKDSGLETGQIGYVVTNLKSLDVARVGDTITLQSKPASEPLAGYRMVTPFVYAGIFPLSADQYPQLKAAVAKLKLNDAALQFEPENSPVLGFGFRMGFLGLLHLEIIKERLEREYQLELVVTSPSTRYRIQLTDGTNIDLHNAAALPDTTKITAIEEPWIKGEIVSPKEYLGAIMQLLNEKRATQTGTDYIDQTRVIIKFEAPLAEMLTEFYDRLKSISRGYGSFSYELADLRPADLVKLSILVAGEPMDSLASIVYKPHAPGIGRQIVTKLKDLIPRQQFEVSLQAAIGGKIIAREDIKALGKNVVANLYGGDVTRKRKLWEKQKAGKKRLKKIGNIEIPTEAFMVMLRKD